MRSTWSGVAVPCWLTRSRSSRAANRRVASAVQVHMTMGWPAWWEMSRRRSARARRCSSVSGGATGSGRPWSVVVGGVGGVEVGHGPSHQLDVVLIGGAGVVGEGEQAVVQQHHAPGGVGGLGREDLGAAPGQVEPGHDVGDDDQLVAVDLADDVAAVGRVGQGHHRVGVGVEHEAVGEGGVQDRLDRGRGSRDVDRRGLELVGHAPVAEAFELGQAGHRARGAGGRTRRARWWPCPNRCP